MNYEKRIGILGGGQLAQMLAQAAYRMGLHCVIYAEDKTAPAAQNAFRVVLGRLNDETQLNEFFNSVDHVIFENEFIDCHKIESISRYFDIQFSPSLKTISILQNKLYRRSFCGS